MIEVRNLIVELDGFTLGPLSLEIGEGEFFIILGPTGAGKTVLLETIAGVHRPSNGRILIEGQDLTFLPPERRGIGIVYQDYSLFPHLTARRNIEFGLRLKGMPKGERERRIQELAQLLGIGHLLDRYPPTLSGGEGQRVALARALAPRPKLLLLDEPLSALDPKIRERLAGELKRINRETGVTFIMVTHEIKEALVLGERIALLKDGKIEQVGRPDQFFSSPATPYVAEFFGVNNVFKARFKGDKALVGDVIITLKAPPKAREGFVVIRPDDIVISKILVSSSARNQFRVEVTSLRDLGSYVEVKTRVGSVEFCVYITRYALREFDLKEGERVFLSFKAMAVETIEIVSP